MLRVTNTTSRTARFTAPLPALPSIRHNRYVSPSTPPSGTPASTSTATHTGPPTAMVALPLFKLGSLFIRHISKYGANRIKLQAHEHPGFRRFAARYGQYIHQFNMRMNVSLLRDTAAELRAKEKAQAPTVKTKEEVEKEESRKLRPRTGTTTTEEGAKKRMNFLQVWRRKFRPLPEEKAVDLFADVLGDAFILFVASAIILYEYQKAAQKPDANHERIKELTARFDELEQREAKLLEAEKQQQERVRLIEAALQGFKDPATKKPLLEPSPLPVALPELRPSAAGGVPPQSPPAA
ncbi:optic atrophy 3 protein-domain-containing protein [Microdochium trichocladiopsis]|uniref:Optic atrophy 3 protein-domain-containing protein n=1 Tax=Microdochium trichocladiopsis TaxID=1682393 RepID=A0A9P8YEA6_9PEZI|nr:optic atrophy 3 protein-domain-containing protein [Microdochium trichocladiopsis]KAH7035366.1 optic atrophy 3 protein-domain-containing protein [Microdochium trichocladiopsis]